MTTPLPFLPNDHDLAARCKRAADFMCDAETTGAQHEALLLAAARLINQYRDRMATMESLTQGLVDALTHYRTRSHLLCEVPDYEAVGIVHHEAAALANTVLAAAKTNGWTPQRTW